MILLIILTILIIPLNKIKAEVRTEGFSKGIIIQPNQTSGSGTYNNVFNNVGEGFIIFTITYNSRGVQAEYYLRPISQLYLTSNNDVYNCEIGNLQTYTDNTKQEIVQSIKCPVNLQNKGITGITIGIKQNSVSERTEYWTSQYATFYTNNENKEIIEAIETQTNQQAQQWMQDATNWSAFENTDISNNAKQQPSQQNYDSVHTFEESIFSDLDDPNILSLIDLGIDTETNTWIWNTMTGIFNANVRVMTMVISVLTLGLAKFLMGR